MRLSGKDGSTIWVPLRDLEKSNPLEMAEHAGENKFTGGGVAFAWWVRHTLRQRNRIIGKVKTRYWTKAHKYGIELPSR